MNKITIIGIGNVGSITAYTLYLCPYIDEIALVDLLEKKGKVESEVLDIIHGLQIQSASRIFCGDYSDCYDSKVIIIAAGRNRNASESRLDLLDTNFRIVKEVVSNIEPYYKDNMVILVTNPNDILTHRIFNMNIFPFNKFFATGCMLDSLRFISQIADKFQLNNKDVKVMWRANIVTCNLFYGAN